MVMSALTKAKTALKVAKEALKKKKTGANVRAAARSTTPKTDKMLPRVTRAQRAKIVRDKRRRAVAAAKNKNAGITAARKPINKAGRELGTPLALAGATLGALPLTKAKTYSVKKGDTLSQIAKREGISLKDIKAANSTIKNLNKINAGQKIKLPRMLLSKNNPYKGMTKAEMAAISKKKPVVKKKMAGGMVKKKIAGGVVKKKKAGGITRAKPKMKMIRAKPKMKMIRAKPKMRMIRAKPKMLRAKPK
jgi:LysM repeat protein